MKKFKDEYPQFYEELVFSELQDDINPEELLCNDKREYLWQCKNGHQWKQVLKNRTRRGGSFCQYCLGKLPYPGESDLATLYPEISQEWDYDKNGDTPIGTATHSKHKKWWICPQGHSYDMRIINRTKGSQNCPYCSGKRVLSGFNDVATTRPDIIKFWDYTKNSITPHEITEKSTKKVWFSCGIPGHSWEGTLSKLGRGKTVKCQVCTGKVVIPGINDLKSQFPKTAQQLVDDIDPSTIYMFSSKKYNWICENGHIRKTKCSYITRDGAGFCYECETQKKEPKKIFNLKTDSIEAKFPDIAQRFDIDKNCGVRPEDVFYGSTRIMWWKCELGHSFKRSVNSYTYHKGECPICANKILLEGFNDFATCHPELLKYWDYEKNDIPPQQYLNNSIHKVVWKCERNSKHSFKKRISDAISSSGGCPICFSSGLSNKENSLYQYVRSILSYNISIIRNDRNIISPLELDIYIPSKNIAIEFNGLYWHTENQGKDRNYHKEKHDACRRKNIQLITIWEDEWDFKREIVKSMIAHKIGVDNSDKVYARKAYVVEINKDSAREFLDKNHIQGFSSGTVYYGLEHDGSLVAVSSWRKLKNTLYLDRYATSCTVVGGMGKLLKQAKQYAKEKSMNEIVTFADKSVSDGSLYELLGFRYDGEIRPDYKYVVNGERKHKFGYRLKRFRNDPNLFYEDGLTEKQLADRNGLKRIWDCGKIRYTMKIE